MDPLRFNPAVDELESEVDNDIRSRAQVARPTGGLEDDANAHDIPDDDGEFEIHRKQLVEHFYQMKHNKAGVSWKCPPAPLLDDKVEPRFIAK